MNRPRGVEQVPVTEGTKGRTVEPRGSVADARRKKYRRPSGEAPPLPRHLGTSGRLLLAGLGCVFVLLVSVAFIPQAGDRITRGELELLGRIESLRTPPVTSAMRAVNDVLGSEWTSRILRWGIVLVLVAFKRFRHLFVFLGSVFLVGGLISVLALTFTRARPTGIDVVGYWEGSAFPSRPIAALTVTLLGITYCLVVPGRSRMTAKVVSTVLIAILAVARIYLGLEHPLDIVVAALLGAAIPVTFFRFFTPNEVFPVSYRGGRAAHLDVGGERGRAIKRALEEQLGITVLEAKPVGLAGSGGSTPLRLRVAGEEGETYLFAKLYAATHLRADRWYKLGRTLLYGRLEDEGSFSTVRRLIQYEDYMLRVMRDAGVNVTNPHGFAEITPEREYVLVTDFLEGAVELLDADVDDTVIDSALGAVRALWDAGIAHRDIKPSNIMVRDGEVMLIDVAFGQVRPSPWRQAVDLANMMLALALKTDPDRVYERALSLFTPDEIAEAFAATHGVTMPSQSRALLKKDRRDLLRRFRELAPARKPVSIQRWSWRRIALTIGVLIATLITVSLVIGNLRGAGLFPAPRSSRAAYSTVTNVPACRGLDSSTLILQAQSVPSASLVPCVEALPTGWNVGAIDVRVGSTRMFLDSDRAGVHAADIILTRSCDVSEASEVPSDEPGTRRFEDIDALGTRYAGTRYYQFSGGCVRYRFDFSGPGRTTHAEEVSLAVSFMERDEIEAELEELSGTTL